MGMCKGDNKEEENVMTCTKVLMRNVCLAALLAASGMSGASAQQPTTPQTNAPAAATPAPASPTTPQTSAPAAAEPAQAAPGTPQPSAPVVARPAPASPTTPQTI